MKRIHASALAVDNRLMPTELTISSGTCLHVLGENGAGKSTLLMVLAGLLPANGGSVTIDSTSAHALPAAVIANYRCFHVQQPVDPFGVSVREYLSFFSAASVSTLLPGAINDVLDIAHLTGRRISELSGGERQRVDIARSLLQIWPAIREGRALIFMDEPFSSLDIRHKYGLAQYLMSLSAIGNICVISSHDLSLSANYSTDVCLLHQGRVIHQGKPGDVMTAANLRTTFQCDMRVEQSNDLIEIHVIRPATPR